MCIDISLQQKVAKASEAQEVLFAADLTHPSYVAVPEDAYFAWLLN